jgi:amino acid transporter
MPTNHGQIAWVYRTFNDISPAIGDFVGFMNVFNLLVSYIIYTAFFPLIFVAYLETLIGDVDSGIAILIKFSIVIAVFSINAANINVISNVVIYLMSLSLLPLVVGFFWRLPDITASQIVRGCDGEYHFSFFITFMSYTSSGYEC